MLRPLSVAVIVSVVSACSSTIDRSRMHSRLAERGRIFASQTLAEAEETKPQLTIPFRVAVAPPLWRSNPRWTEKERAIIQRFGAEAQAAGLVSAFELIPAASWELSKSTDDQSGLESLRVAAARQHADALLVIRDIDDWSQWVNPLSLLDLTIVGAFFVPGHTGEAVSMMDALLLDNRNLYLYATAESEGHAKKTTSYTELREDDLVDEAREKALNRLGQDLLAQARAHATQPASP